MSNRILPFGLAYEFEPAKAQVFDEVDSMINRL
jgi:hypothetical protein